MRRHLLIRHELRLLDFGYVRQGGSDIRQRGSDVILIHVCEPLGIAKAAGTSYAAPWIARKLSYLIDVLGLNREAAKAMIIDSARDWNDAPTPEEAALYGHGIVPKELPFKRLAC